MLDARKNTPKHRILLFVLLCACFSFGHVLHADGQDGKVSGPSAGIATFNDLDNWVNFYYLNPRPDLTVQAIRMMADLGLFEREQKQPPLIAFLGLLFYLNQNEVPLWLKDLGLLKDEHKMVVWSALWFSDTDSARTLLKRISEKASQDNKTFISTLLDQTPPNLLTMDINAPVVIDMLWGAFFASGKEEYVVRIISVLTYSKLQTQKTSNTITRMLTGEAAKWSLQSNAVQHKRVYGICRQQLEKQPEDIRAVLNEIILEAEKELKAQNSSR